MTPARNPRGFGSVYLDSRGRWLAELTHEGRHYRRVRRSQAEAMAALDELKAAVRVGLDPRTPPTLHAFLSEWVSTLRVRATTLRGYRSKLELYVIPAIGNTRLDRLTPGALRRLFMDLEREGLSARTVSHVRSILRNALRRAEQDGYVSRNVAALTDPVPVANVERRVLTLDEARQLAEALHRHRLEALYAIAMTLGLRQSEVLGLRWGDIVAAQIRSASTATAGRAAGARSLQAGFGPAMGKGPSEHATASLHVRQTLHRLDRAVLLEPPKTPRSRRDVPLTDSIVSLLLARRVIQKAELLSSGARPEHDLVFTTVRGAPLSGPSVTRELSRVLHEAGLPHVSFHDLRHVAASNLAARGFTLREVQAILGHASVTTTANTYLHSDDGELARKMRTVSW